MITLVFGLMRALWVGCFSQIFTTRYLKFMLEVTYELDISMILAEA